MLSVWTQEGFVPGLITGMVVMAVIVALWELYDWWRKNRIKRQGKKMVRAAERRRAIKEARDREAIRYGGQVEPEVSVPPRIHPAPSPPKDPTSPPGTKDQTQLIGAVSPTDDETRQQPLIRRPPSHSPGEYQLPGGVRPRMSPPPPLPGGYGSTVWDGENRRSDAPAPYDGPERRGARHRDPDDVRRRRRDDPHERE